MWRSFCCALLCLGLPVAASAQDLNFPTVSAGDTEALSMAMQNLALQVMVLYQDDNRARYLDNLFRQQTVAGKYSDATQTLASLRALRAGGDPGGAKALHVQYEIYIRAKGAQIERRIPFEVAYRQSFRDTLGPLDERTAALVINSIALADESALRRALDDELARHNTASNISLKDALTLIRAYQADEAYREFTALTPALVEEDDHRRYLIDTDVLVPTSNGAGVCALIVRSRAASGRLPALLDFTIYTDPTRNLSDARRTASNGYVGVVGLTRGKGCSPGRPVPYEHDGADAAALIDWITTQNWSDGRVGMYGGSYDGFTQWAAAKHRPKGLKALMPGAPVAPGIDVPMEGNVFWNFLYPWPFYTTNVKGLDDKTYSDTARWTRLDRDWYVRGRAYRDLDKIDGTPNPIFDEWIAHPNYDAYWRAMIPDGAEFAHIHIPILATAGYYYGGPGAALWYFTQHQRFDRNAEHYLLVGPYDHVRGHRGTVDVLGDPILMIGGYELDPVAQLDLGQLRYEWFDYVLKGARKPALLADKVNYEVTGANVWKHAPTVAAMANGTLRLHFTAQKFAGHYRLIDQEPAPTGRITQSIDLADRTDADRVTPGGGVSDRVIDTQNGIEFVSDPIGAPMELSGLFSGRLDVTANKRDFDFSIDLYELTPGGDYLQLSQFWSRASYVRDRGRRTLLTPGKLEHLAFDSGRLMSRKLQTGSRIVAVLGVIKESGRQINYGTGRDVSDETIADTHEPLGIEWRSSSYVVLPVWR